MTPHGNFHWNELVTPKAERAKKFYEITIGWSFEPMPLEDGATYRVAVMDGRPVAGIFPTDRPAGLRGRAGRLDVISRRR